MLSTLPKQLSKTLSKKYYNRQNDATKIKKPISLVAKTLKKYRDIKLDPLRSQQERLIDIMMPKFWSSLEHYPHDNVSIQSVKVINHDQTGFPLTGVDYTKIYCGSIMHFPDHVMMNDNLKNVMKHTTTGIITWSYDEDPNVYRTCETIMTQKDGVLTMLYYGDLPETF